MLRAEMQPGTIDRPSECVRFHIRRLRGRLTVRRGPLQTLNRFRLIVASPTSAGRPCGVSLLQRNKTLIGFNRDDDLALAMTEPSLQESPK